MSLSGSTSEGRVHTEVRDQELVLCLWFLVAEGNMLKFTIAAALEGTEVERNSVWLAMSLRCGNVDAKDVAVSVQGENSNRMEKSAKNLGGVGGVAENAGDCDDFEEKEAGGVGGVAECPREIQIYLENGAVGRGGVGGDTRKGTPILANLR
jgi:hypothetical protein